MVGMAVGMQRANSGYTLLEILVVLVIISIVAGVALLTIGHNDNKELQAFTRELTQTLTLAEEQALLQPVTLGLMFTTHSFRFYEYRQTRSSASWQALNDRELGLHRIPEDIQLSLQINDKILPLEPVEGKLPALFVSTNGTLTPFTLLIGKKNKKPRYQLIGHADGSITSQRYTG